MKLSTQWVQQFTTINLERDELVRRIGSQLGAVEEVEDWGAYYDDKISIARITKASDHPDADKLGVYELDTGDETVTVCAGDKTLQEGDAVAYIPPGSAVPLSVKEGEPFVIEKRELRGVESNGMMGSAKELLISDSHEGVLKLDTDAEAGASFKEEYKLDDVIIDIENKMFTHRPDLFGIIGLAREIAGIQNIEFTSPEWYRESPDITSDSNELPLHVSIDVPELCPRFSAVVLKGVEVKDSNIQTQSFLTRVGLRPINNVVDITNIGMYLTAQPTHAFDYDKVAKKSGGDAHIVVRKPSKGEKITLLDGREIEPGEDVAMVATKDELLSVGGSIGGADSEVDASTTNVILEAASWDLYSIRRTSFAHGIFTDAVTRFNKGQNPRQTLTTLNYLIDLFQSEAGATLASDVIDEYPAKTDQPNVELTADFINQRLGSTFETTDVTAILNNVELQTSVEGDSIAVVVPFWRTDLEVAEDIVEEIGRLHGYDNLPIDVPKRKSQPNLRTEELAQKGEIRQLLASAGARDILTYNFVSSSLFAKAGYSQELIDSAYRIRNSLSPELEYMRISLLPSVVDKVNANIRSGHGTFTLFEINKSHNREQQDHEELPEERTTLALVVASDRQQNGSPYFQAKRYIDYLCAERGLEVAYRPESDGDRSTPLGASVASLFAESRMASVEIDGEFAGLIGEFSSGVKNRFKLPEYSAGFELDVDALSGGGTEYQALSRFPASTQDITLETPNQVDYADLAAMIQKTLQTEEHTVNLWPLGIYRANPESLRRISFRVRFQSPSRTLTTTEINESIAALTARLSELDITQV